MQIQFHKFLEVCSDDLIRIDKDDLLEIHGEENIEEENLVCPDDTLFFFLSPKPRRPFVRDKLILEIVGRGEMRDEFLQEYNQRR